MYLLDVSPVLVNLGRGAVALVIKLMSYCDDQPESRLSKQKANTMGEQHEHVCG